MSERLSWLVNFHTETLRFNIILLLPTTSFRQWNAGFFDFFFTSFAHTQPLSLVNGKQSVAGLQSQPHTHTHWVAECKWQLQSITTQCCHFALLFFSLSFCNSFSACCSGLPYMVLCSHRYRLPFCVTFVSAAKNKIVFDLWWLFFFWWSCMNLMPMKHTENKFHTPIIHSFTLSKQKKTNKTRYKTAAKPKKPFYLDQKKKK